VVWLLLNGELPSMAQLSELNRRLADERQLPPALVEMLELLPSGTHPMDSLRTGVSMLAAFDPELNDNSAEANRRKALRIIAKTSRLIADGWRLANGQELLPPKRDLTHAGNFLYQLNAEVPDVASIECFDSFLVLYAEHGFNASTFSCRVTASTLAHVYAAVTTGVGTLKGPLHGGANEQAMKILREIGSPDRVEHWVKEKLVRKEKVIGFGHRVYDKGDARVPVMKSLAVRLSERFGQPRWVQICSQLEVVMKREKGLYPNLDLYAAPVLYLLGVPPELNTAVFAAARTAGWCAHVIEQQDHNRLIRPRSRYTGHQDREYPKRANRSAA
jgi:citrate synthase